MAYRYQNQAHPKGRTPTYYAGNNLWPQASAPIDVPGRTSRRIHDNLNFIANYGLDVQSPDVAASPYSSPYYINGRYYVEDTIYQTGTSSSVQGVAVEYPVDNRISQSESLDEQQTAIKMWQGKQIRFKMPCQKRKIVGNRFKLKNTDNCTGVLSIYLSQKKDSEPLYETSIDLCTIARDKFEEVELYANTVVPEKIAAAGEIWVRLEIWDEIECERSENPFNTGKTIEIAATGAGNHEEWVYELGDKNEPATEEVDWGKFSLPNRPLIAFFYSDYESVPVERIANEKEGATVSHKNRRYDIFCIKSAAEARVIVYNRFLKKFEPGGNIKVDKRIERLTIAQVVDTDGINWVYYTDGYSPLQRFRVGVWQSEEFAVGDAEKITATLDEDKWFSTEQGKVSGSYKFTYNGSSWQFNKINITLSDYGITLAGGTPANGARIYIASTVTEGDQHILNSIAYTDTRPVLAPSIIVHHNNRLYLTGFRNDRNLVQFTEIDEEGPNYTSFPYRFYAPNRSPLLSTLNPIVDVVEYSSDQLMFFGPNFASLFQTNVNAEDATPQQVSLPSVNIGVQGPGDVVSYKGVLYSFSPIEGIRRFSGSTWSHIPNAIDNYLDRVDMDKPRKLWGNDNKLYFQYTDKVDGRRKAIIYDMNMDYQQYPWFQDVDTPFTDVRMGDGEDIFTIHPDYPIVLRLYAEDTWRRLDTPIEFRRDTKFVYPPGNGADLILKRVYTSVLANANRWWWLSIAVDKHNLEQVRGKGPWYRIPVWNTVRDDGDVEDPFYGVPLTEKSATYRVSLTNLRIRASAFQLRVRAKTFRQQASLESMLFEIAPRNYL